MKPPASRPPKSSRLKRRVAHYPVLIFSGFRAVCSKKKKKKRKKGKKWHLHSGEPHTCRSGCRTIIAGRLIGEEEYDSLRWQIHFHLVWCTCLYITHFRGKTGIGGERNSQFLFWQCEFASVPFAANPVIWQSNWQKWCNATQWLVKTISKSDSPLK